MIDRFQRFVFDISVIFRQWHKIAADRMREYGLGGPYAIYFVTLAQNPAGLTPSELCELCGRDKSDVSRALSRLSEKGLIEKVIPAGASYRARVILTPQGQTIAAGVAAKAEKAVCEGGEGLTDEERKVLYDCLDRIAANLCVLSKKEHADR